MSHSAPSHGHAGHAAHADHGVRKYWVVFFMLAILTIVTVAIARVHLPTPMAIGLALAVATTKATLVALFFMHLIDERKVIYWTLALCALFFALLIFLPMLTDAEQANIVRKVSLGA